MGVGGGREGTCAPLNTWSHFGEISFIDVDSDREGSIFFWHVAAINQSASTIDQSKHRIPECLSSQPESTSIVVPNVTGGLSRGLSLVYLRGRSHIM